MKELKLNSTEQAFIYQCYNGTSVNPKFGIPGLQKLSIESSMQDLINEIDRIEECTTFNIGFLTSDENFSTFDVLAKIHLMSIDDFIQLVNDAIEYWNPEHDAKINYKPNKN